MNTLKKATHKIGSFCHNESKARKKTEKAESSIYQLFKTLPVELINKIFKEMEPSNVEQLGRTSKSFNDLANKDSFWESSCRDQVPEIKNICNLPWKQIYIEKIDIRRFLCGSLCF